MSTAKQSDMDHPEPEGGAGSPTIRDTSMVGQSYHRMQVPSGLLSGVLSRGGGSDAGKDEIGGGVRRAIKR